MAATNSRGTLRQSTPTERCRLTLFGISDRERFEVKPYQVTLRRMRRKALGIVWKLCAVAS